MPYNRSDLNPLHIYPWDKSGGSGTAFVGDACRVESITGGIIG